MTEFESLTEADQLVAHVAKLWPKYPFTPEQASNRLRRWQRYGLTTLFNALSDWESENPDERRPKWAAVGAVLKGQATERYCRGDRRETNCYRFWFSSPMDMDTPPAYAQELKEADDEEDLGVEFWHQWYLAAQTTRKLHFYYWRYPWPPERPILYGPRALPKPGDPLPKYEAAKQHREQLLRTAHFLVRNLETVGGATERKRDEWLRRIEQDAFLGGLEIAV